MVLLGRQEAEPLTIRLTVQPIFLFSVSSPFMQSLGGRAQMSVPGSQECPWDDMQNCRVTEASV